LLLIQLELEVDAYANDVVGTRVGLGTRIALASSQTLLIVVVIDATEITSIQTYLVGEFDSSTQTNAITVAGKRGVLLIVIGDSVVGTLYTT
jgi:hypothetical protein